MGAYSKTRAVLFTFSALIVTEAQHCGKREQDIVHYDFPSCPDPAFELADSVGGAPYRLGPPTKAFLPPPQDCSAFKMYTFWEGSQLRVDVGFRLNRGQSFSLDAAYNTSREDFWEISQWADIAARLVMQSATVAPKVPAAKIERFQKTNEFYARCAGKADHASP